MEYFKGTRRDFLASAGAGLASLVVDTAAAAPAAGPVSVPAPASAPATTQAAVAGAGAAGGAANPANLTLLTSIDGVQHPAKGEGQMKFSFPWPEPSVPFGGLLFAFEMITFENAYAIDPALATVSASADGITLQARGFTWAGGQEKAAGYLEAVITRQPDQALVWQVAVRFDQAVKALKTIVRGLPRGRLSSSAGRFQEPGEDEKIYEYPDLMTGMGTPLLALEGKDGLIRAISALQTEVRPARFFFWPGQDGYKLELLYEQAGWDRRGDVRTHPWRIGTAATFEAAVRPHFAHLEQAYQLPRFERRPDAPEWMRHLGLVLALHGQHWSGHIFNDYQRQLEILQWASRKTEPRQTMVFLAGWDARYYWDYPRFELDPRMGGEAAFQRLIKEGQKLGYRFALMFGSNVANPAWAGYAGIANARVRNVYGDPMAGNYVDWDGDRKGDSSMVIMNLGVDSWREHLEERISAMVARYGVDAYFLDICGLWENNPDGDMFVGTRKLVQSLARRHPGVAAIAEMEYDAQMGIIPMAQVTRYGLYPQGHFDYVASFSHLSTPAPGSGSSGVHESGFGTYKPVKPDQREIPTITFSGDTLARYPDLVAADMATAAQRLRQRGGRT